MHLALLLLTRDHVLVGYKQILKIMSQEAILEKVRSIVAEQLSVDAAEIKPDSNFQTTVLWRRTGSLVVEHCSQITFFFIG